ncbi:MAG TPA: fluoride efflux transporter CrcB [Actinomycetota bacterium]|nr:fluoride efflux transporter CrcB [Actinomycetota bacterium]
MSRHEDAAHHLHLTHHDPQLPIDPDRDSSLPEPSGARVPPGLRPGILAAIALGAALGAPARYEVAQLIHVARDGFPWATFWTNISGSLALGVILVLILERFPPTRYLRPFIATGFLGAYTTYSTFAVEADLLAKDGHAGVGLVYAVVSLLAGFVAVWVGISFARGVRLGRLAVRQ